MTAIAVSHPRTDPMSTGSPGFSAVADVVREWLAKTNRHARNNASDWRTLAKTLVHALREEAAPQAERGLALGPLAETVALQFLDALPISLPAPEVALDPDGEVSFDWWFAPNAQFSISVGATGNLTYAGIIGPGVKRHGVEPFEKAIPQILLDTLDQLVERFGSPQHT
jgi:hypothetical protein